MTAGQLYVFAGPNGAGKSTFAASMVPQGTPIFDGDKKFAELKGFFYDLDESRIWTSTMKFISRSGKRKEFKKKAMRPSKQIFVIRMLLNPLSNS